MNSEMAGQGDGHASQAFGPERGKDIEPPIGLEGRVDNPLSARCHLELTVFTLPALIRCRERFGIDGMLPRCQDLPLRSIIKTLSPVIEPVAVRRFRS